MRGTAPFLQVGPNRWAPGNVPPAIRLTLHALVWHRRCDGPAGWHVLGSRSAARNARAGRTASPGRGLLAAAMLAWYFTPADAATVPGTSPRSTGGHCGQVSRRSAGRRRSCSRRPRSATALPFTATALANGDYLLVPDAPLVAGTDYTIVDHTACGATPDAGPLVTFHAVAAAPLPASLGTLAIVDHQEETFSVATARGSCSSDVLADQARVELTPRTTRWPGRTRCTTRRSSMASRGAPRPASTRRPHPVRAGLASRSTASITCARPTTTRSAAGSPPALTRCR